MPAGAALTVMGRVSARKPDAHAEVTDETPVPTLLQGHFRECSRASRLPSHSSAHPRLGPALRAPLARPLRSVGTLYRRG